MKIKSYLKPWILITTGIVMNIISAVLTHYFISQNNTELQLIDQQITNIESNIESQWQTKIEMERKKEFILLLLNQHDLTTIKKPIKDYLEQHLTRLQQYSLSKPPLTVDLSINQTIRITQLAQKSIIDDINNQYFQKLELESAKKPLQDHNAQLYSLAIFMQLIGLILVLSRDLAR